MSPPLAKVIKIPETITVKEFSEKLGTSPSEIIKKLMKMGIMATVNQNLNPELVKQVAAKMGFDVEMAPVEEVEEVVAEVEDPTPLQATRGDGHGACRSRENLSAGRHPAYRRHC